MSRAFLGFAMAFSIFILWLNVTSSRRNPALIILWLVIGGLSAYKLFKSPSQNS